MDYMTIKEASALWGIGTRIITVYCVEGRIDGAIKRGNLWLIPVNSTRPVDKRQKKVPIGEGSGIIECEKSHDYYKQERSLYLRQIQSLYESKGPFVEIIKHFPYPMHICAPDGTMLLANRAYLEFAKIKDPGKLYKKHNILENPNLERWGIKDFTERAFKGEVIHADDIKVPHQEIIETLGDSKEIAGGDMFHNMTAFPIRDENNELIFIVFIFIISRYYQGREEIIRAKEYIDSHWIENFDLNKLADMVHMSRYHFTRIFKQYTGITPYHYYQDVKIQKLEEKLLDKNLSIAQAFTECGIDYNGSFGKLFKQKTGMSPLQYRTKMTKK